MSCQPYETSPGQPGALLLAGAAAGSGSAKDVLVVDRQIAALGDRARSHPGARGARLVDLEGFVLLEAPAEPHAHLDKAFLAERVRNESGDLLGAIAAMAAAYPSISGDDITMRARRALGKAMARGYSAVRTHVDCNPLVGLSAIESLVGLRDELDGLITVQVVALMGRPITGRDGEASRRLLDAALERGVDVVGGAPALDPAPSEAIKVLVAAATGAGCPIDLHLDETTDETVMNLAVFAQEVDRHGLGGKAVASHCVSLGQQEERRAREIASLLAGAGIAVVTLPQTNLYLQGRGAPVRVPRGLTAIEILREQGAVVAGGGDNWRDPFNPLGRIDPFETASLLVSAGHMGIGDAYMAVSSLARQAIGLAPCSIEEGSQADILGIKAASLEEAVADASEERIVIKAGRIVSWTQVVQVAGH